MHSVANVGRGDKTKKPEQPYGGSGFVTMTPRGFELVQESSGNSQDSNEGDSLSDSLGHVSDSRLARLIEVWPGLSADARDAILALAGCDATALTDSTS